MAPSATASRPEEHRHHRHTRSRAETRGASFGFISSITIIASVLVLVAGIIIFQYPETTQLFHKLAKPSPTDRYQTQHSQESPADVTKSTTAPTMASIRRTTPLVFEATGRHTATVIFSHGLGDTGNGWASAVEHWRRRQKLNEVKFILPHAPHIPITVNGGMKMPGWFDLASLGGSIEDLKSHAATEDGPGILASREYFNSLIQQEVSAGIPADRIVLGGFSQGGAMSLFSGITSPVKIAGIVGLSSWLVLSQSVKDHIPEGNPNKDTPIFMGHGDEDPLVRYELAAESQKILKGMGHDVKFEVYKGMAHSACLEELDEVEKFLVERLPAKGGN